MKQIEFVDSILNNLRLNSKDRFVSRRHVLSIAKEKMRLLISQKLMERSLYRDSGIVKDISCFEMQEIDVVKCDIVEFRTCNKVMKSRKKLPEVIYSRYGDSIRMVTNLDTSLQITRTSPTDYLRDKVRDGYKPTPKYYVRDGYLYIVDSEVEVVNVQIITLDTKGIETASCEGVDPCKPVIEYEFVGTDKLTEIVRGETLKELMGTYMQIHPDERPDNNQKSI